MSGDGHRPDLLRNHHPAAREFPPLRANRLAKQQSVRARAGADGEWRGNGEWGMGSGEWRIRKLLPPLPTLHSQPPFLAPHSPCTYFPGFEYNSTAEPRTAALPYHD